jgi:hypothetical protein
LADAAAGYRPRAKVLALFTAAGVSAALMSACGGLTQMQDSLAKFDHGAHVVAASQTGFLNAVHAVECETRFFAAAYAYSRDNALPIDLRAQCAADKLYLNSAQIEIRQKLLDAIVLYADELQALGSADDDKNLDKDSQAAARNLNKQAGGLEWSRTDASIGRDVEAAVVSLTSMILDQKKKEGVQLAARNQQDNLSKIVDALKAENLSLASGVDDDIGSIRANLTATLSTARNREGAAVFFDVIRARGYLQTLSPFGSHGLDNSAGGENPDIDPAVAVKPLNSALDGLVKANNAIAAAGHGGVRAAVTDLAARAQAAQAFQTAITK